MAPPVGHWLPDLVLLGDHGGDWDAYVEAVYAGFRADFLDSKPPFNGSDLALKRFPLLKGKEATFWHIVSEGEYEDERLPDLRRCERIRWPRAIIERAGLEDVRLWQNSRKGEARSLIALPDFSYVVVLAHRSGYTLFWTAYPVQSDFKRGRLESEYRVWMKTKNG